MSSTDRVKAHRQNKGMLRVEIEVASLEDKAAVRAFAASLRSPALPAPSKPAAQPTDLGKRLGALDDQAVAIVSEFVDALALSTHPSLRRRAETVAFNLGQSAKRYARLPL